MNEITPPKQMTPIEMLEALHEYNVEFGLAIHPHATEGEMVHVWIETGAISSKNFSTPTEAITWLYQKAKELGVL